jgi:hypothetical protein
MTAEEDLAASTFGSTTKVLMRRRPDEGDVYLRKETSLQTGQELRFQLKCPRDSQSQPEIRRLVRRANIVEGVRQHQ